MRALVKSRREEGLDYVEDRPLPDGLRGRRGRTGPHRGAHPREEGRRLRHRSPYLRVGRLGAVASPRASSRGTSSRASWRRWAWTSSGSPRATASAGEGHITNWLDYNSRTGNAHIARDTRIIGVDTDGCFAEYLILPQSNVWPLHDEIPDRFGAVMDPLGNAVHTVMEAGVSANSVLITGVGIIGLMSVSVARAAGASRIYVTDTNTRSGSPSRRSSAPTRRTTRSRTRASSSGSASRRGARASTACWRCRASPRRSIRASTRCATGAPRPCWASPPDRSLRHHEAGDLQGREGAGHQRTAHVGDVVPDGDVPLSGKLGPRQGHHPRAAMEDYEDAFALMQSGEGIKIVLNVDA